MLLINMTKYDLHNRNGDVNIEWEGVEPKPRCIKRQKLKTLLINN